MDYRVGISGPDIIDISYVDVPDMSWGAVTIDEKIPERVPSHSCCSVQSGESRNLNSITYRMVENADVFEGPHALSPIVANLKVDARVEILQVKCNMEQRRFWAKIIDPSGWFTIRTMDDGC